MPIQLDNAATNLSPISHCAELIGKLPEHFKS